MNYRLIYSNLIFKALARANNEGYFERHHIVPKSLGGIDDKANLVKLTAREHFIAHCLLAKIYGETQWSAVILMKGEPVTGKYNRYINSRLYEIAKKKCAIETSKQFKCNTYGSAHKGKPRPDISAALKGRKRPEHSEKLKGRKRPDVSKRQLGTKQTEEHKLAIKTGKSIRNGKPYKHRGVKLTVQHSSNISIAVTAYHARKRFDRECIALNALISSVFQ